MNGLRKGWLDARNPLMGPCRSGAALGWRRLSGWGLGLLVAVLPLAPLTDFARAEDGVYTWRDASGRVHYGNRPPEGQPANTVRLNAKPVTVQPTEHIYTWTDAGGKVHYGAKPPADGSAKELKEDDSSLSTIRSSTLRPGEQQLLRELQQRQ